MVPILLLSENTVQSITSEVSPDMVLGVFGSNRLLYCSTRATDWCRSTLMQNTHLAVLHHQSVTLSPNRLSEAAGMTDRLLYSTVTLMPSVTSGTSVTQFYNRNTQQSQHVTRVKDCTSREEFVLTPVLSWAQYEAKGYFCLFLTVKI